MTSRQRIRRLLVANRSEIAIRVMRASAELGISTVGVYSEEDRFALHRFKADQSYRIGEPGKPIGAYLNIEEMLRVAHESGADAVHPGYGFLSENPNFADACRDAGLIFVGPKTDAMRALGNKVSARNLAVDAGVPVMPATEPLPPDLNRALAEADKIGYPLMLKASWGGGGRGMRVVRTADDLKAQFDTARREAEAAFGNGEVYLEKLVERARHVEVQILGDHHGTLVHLFERDCTVQRRNQKVIERAPSPYLDDERRELLCNHALALGKEAGYVNAGTVEFLMDADTGDFYFIEVNPRIQVEHTVTEQVTGIDIVKAQIRVAEGLKIGDPESFVPKQSNIRLHGHALQCRVTTEDPENNFTPDYGRIRAYRGATGFGIRLDGGTAYSGALITPFYDSLLEKVTAWSVTGDDAIARMDRALREFRIRGVTTNLLFLEQIINHPDFAEGNYTTRFIDQTPELYRFPKRRDRATRLLRFIGEVQINGNREVAGRLVATERRPAPLPPLETGPAPEGTVQRLKSLGAEKFAAWMLEQQQVLITDTTMRDAHQSLFATRMRSADLLRIAPAYAKLLPELFSIECWGGATFDAAMRFLKEDPWARLRNIKARAPNILLQMLLRASNAVGYKNYPDNVVRYFVGRAADAGVDVFRVFDSLNWVENMRVAMDAVIESGKLCEATICYTGDLTDPAQTKYDLEYYVSMARQLEKAGAHILGIKDMAGVCKPEAARRLVSALKQEVGIPLHFHTHDTSGVAAASVLAAVEAGCDAVDGAMDAMSGLTSQPNLGSIVEALRHGDRDPGLSRESMRQISGYWEGVRRFYASFEPEIRAGTSDVYRHAMPGGQYTNLREQARSLGIDHRWPEVAQRYAEVNDMFGDIVKVTPTSKVVGDMALFMVTSGLTPDDVTNPEKEIAFPESVVQLFAGELGQPPGGWPAALQAKVLNGGKADTSRPGDRLPPTDLDSVREEAVQKIGRQLSDDELASYLMYPKVFTDYAAHRRQYSDVSILPTPVFFFGLDAEEEIAVDLEPGKALIIRLLAVSDANEEGIRRLFFELNGQPRSIAVADMSVNPSVVANRKAEEGNPLHVAAPMPGLVVGVTVSTGQQVAKGDPLVALEAMKMETVLRAERDGTVRSVPVSVGTQVEAHDLLVEFAD
ncbi:MAG: pyruvate carboxylase [Myxococcota bacterium]